MALQGAGKVLPAGGIFDARPGPIRIGIGAPLAVRDGEGRPLPRQALAERASAASPARLAQAVLGEALDDETATALRRAESARQGVALLLASPAFQWRT